MKLSFSEESTFAKLRDSLFGPETTSSEYPAFQAALMDNPRAGAVIPGAGGARKIRWADPSRGKGKRSGIRVIYFYLEEADRILFLAAYDKNVEDMTPDEKKEVARLIQAFRDEVLRKRKKS